MPAIQRYINLAAVIMPFLAFIAALGLLLNSAVGWSDLPQSGRHVSRQRMGIDLLPPAHPSRQTYKPLEYALAIAGSMAVQGPMIGWVADHRKPRQQRHRGRPTRLTSATGSGLA